MHKHIIYITDGFGSQIYPENFKFSSFYSFTQMKNHLISQQHLVVIFLADFELCISDERVLNRNLGAQNEVGFKAVRYQFAGSCDNNLSLIITTCKFIVKFSLP